MKKTNFKLFTMFLAGIAFSALTVFAATISISTNFEDGAIQYLKKLVILMDNNNTGIILDGSNSKIMSNNICDKDGNNCKIVSQLITGSALNSYLTGTSSFLTGENTKWCIMSGGNISCFENAPSGIGGDSVWMTGASKIYYNSGNVGIGTDEPTEKFQVGNNAQIGYDFSCGSGTNTSGGVFLRLISQPSQLSCVGDNVVKHTPNIQLDYGNNNWQIDNTSLLRFKYATGSHDYSDKMTLNSAGLMTLYGSIKLNTSGYISATMANKTQLYLGNNGRIGINTNDPQEMLHVNGTIQAGDNLKTYTSLSSLYGIIESNNQLRFNTNGNNTRMTIDNNGNVGIGTTGPSTKLEVNGTGKFNQITFPGGSNIMQENTSPYNMHVVGGEFGPGDHGNVILTQNGSAKGGEVGIGTSSPSAKLHIHGTTSNIPLLSVTKNSDSYFHIADDGNVGIGTGTPQAKFHITKPVWGDGGNKYLIKASLDNSSNNLFWVHDGGDTYIDGWLGIGINPLKAQGNTEEHALLVNGTSYLSGNVGIGKNPSYKLDVAGTGHFEKGLIVDGTAQIGNNLKLKTVGDHGTIYSNNNLYLYVSGSTQAVIIDTDKNMTVKGNVTATAFYYDSDERLKTDISTIVNPLQKILSLSGYNFTWIKDGRQDIGIIAQEVEKIFPEIVQTNPEGYKSVEYGNLVAPLIEAIKELNAKIDRQAQEIAILKASIQ